MAWPVFLRWWQTNAKRVVLGVPLGQAGDAASGKDAKNLMSKIHLCCADKLPLLKSKVFPKCLKGGGQGSVSAGFLDKGPSRSAGPDHSTITKHFY